MVGQIRFDDVYIYMCKESQSQSSFLHSFTQRHTRADVPASCQARRTMMGMQGLELYCIWMDV